MDKYDLYTGLVLWINLKWESYRSLRDDITIDLIDGRISIDQYDREMDIFINNWQRVLELGEKVVFDEANNV